MKSVSSAWFQAGSISTQFDLMLILSEGSSLTGNLIYSSDIFTEGTAARMAGHFKVATNCA